jgi:hypothetical protein
MSRINHSGLNGCCTAVWKANGKNYTIYLFCLDGTPCKNKDKYGYSITLTKRDDTGK